MTLLKDFYQLDHFTHTEGVVSAQISFNRDHAIFKGHFPDHPIVPGVCMMQIVTEIMEKALAQPLMVSKAETLKFLALINPEQHRNMEASLTYKKNEKGTFVQASLFNPTGTFFKLKATLTTR